MNTVLLSKWLKAMTSVMPYGGKRLAAERLGLSSSGLSKLLHRPDRAFDEKTIRAMSWILTSKSERYSVDLFPVVREKSIDGLIIETRSQPDGGEFQVWRLDPAAKGASDGQPKTNT